MTISSFIAAILTTLPAKYPLVLVYQEVNRNRNNGRLED
jgi:hypothetical protein